MRVLIFTLLLMLMQAVCFSQEAAKECFEYPKVKILASTYYAHNWGDHGRYKRVSKNGKRLGNYVALNFLPGGSIIQVPELFKTTTFEVADTFGGTGYGYYKGKKYWKVDFLRNKNEWYDNFDHPMDLYIVKYNMNGPVKNAAVRKNCRLIYNTLRDKLEKPAKKPD